MANEFSRTEMLIGPEGMKLLSHSCIMIFGIGGVGSHCVEAFARCGIGRLILVDNDQVSVTNINRQAVAYQSTLGKDKTEVMKAIIHQINPMAQVLTINAFVLPDNLDALMKQLPEEWSQIDFIVDAIDTVSAKLALAEWCFHRSIPLISSMGTGNKLHPELFQIADLYATSVCPLCRVMRRECKARGISSLKVLYSREQPLKPIPMNGEEKSGRPAPGSISFVPPVAGLMIAGEVVRTLLNLN